MSLECGVVDPVWLDPVLLKQPESLHQLYQFQAVLTDYLQRPDWTLAQLATHHQVSRSSLQRLLQRLRDVEALALSTEAKRRFQVVDALLHKQLCQPSLRLANKVIGSTAAISFYATSDVHPVQTLFTTEAHWHSWQQHVVTQTDTLTPLLAASLHTLIKQSQHPRLESNTDHWLSYVDKSLQTLKPQQPRSDSFTHYHYVRLPQLVYSALQKSYPNAIQSLGKKML